MCNQLDKSEEIKDKVEQNKLVQFFELPVPVPVPVPEYHFDDMDFDMGGPGFDESYDESDADGEFDDGEPDFTMPRDHFTDSAPAFSSDPFANYIRVVHSNGIHHIAMASCECHGQDILPLDLFAAQCYRQA